MAKKIVIDARELRTSTGRYIERLLYYLQQIDNEHDYIVLLKPQDIVGWQPTSKHFTKMLCPYKEFTFSEQLGFLQQLNKIRADLVHFPMVQQPILYRGNTVTTMQDLTTCRFRNPTKNWLVFTVKQQVYKFVNWYVPRKSTRVITPTEYVKRDITDFAGVRPEKLIVTHEAADPIPYSPVPPSLPILQKTNFIMYVGRPLPHKNLGHLIEAFTILQKTYPSLHLVFVGKKDTMYGQIENGVRAMGTKNVVFTDFVSEAELRWLYENCAVYVFPSLSEGFGLPGLEAMLHSAPVASSNATCLPEVYGEAAQYFNPLDIQDMATKIAEVLGDEKLRTQLVKKGHEQAKKYSWHRMAEETLLVYKEALGETTDA